MSYGPIRRRRGRTFDPKCFILAEQFLQDTKVDQNKVPKLAQLIQETIEDFITEHEAVEKEPIYD